MAEKPESWHFGPDTNQGRINYCFFAVANFDVLTAPSQWNFEKFLVDKNGNVVHRWASTTTPASIDAEVAKLL